MSEPYKPPSPEEVHESGTADWVDQALEVHERKQQRLSSMLDPDREALRKQKESLQQMWSVSGKTEPAPKEAPPTPDVFAEERARNTQAQAKLASVFEEDVKTRAQEDDQLRNFFGGGGQKTNSSSNKKKPRR